MIFLYGVKYDADMFLTDTRFTELSYLHHVF